MGYRSTGWFMIPRSATRELERRHRANLDKEEQQRIKDKEAAEKDPDKHFIYAETRPWDSLTGFDTVDLFEKDGREYVRYSFDGWKWYSGYPFPQLVETLLWNISDPHEIVDDPSEAYLEDITPVLSGSLGINQPTLMGWEMEPDHAIFVRSGEDWNDVVIFDQDGYIDTLTDMDGNPWFNGTDCIFVLLDRSFTPNEAQLDIDAKYEAYDKAEMELKALKPDHTDLTGDYPTLHWSTADIGIWRKIAAILNELEEAEVYSAAVRFNSDDLEYDSIGDYYDYDIYVNAGWDETPMMKEFEYKGNFPITEIHPYLLPDQKL